MGERSKGWSQCGSLNMLTECLLSLHHATRTVLLGIWNQLSLFWLLIYWLNLTILANKHHEVSLPLADLLYPLNIVEVHSYIVETDRLTRTLIIITINPWICVGINLPAWWFPPLLSASFDNCSAARFPHIPETALTGLIFTSLNRAEETPLWIKGRMSFICKLMIESKVTAECCCHHDEKNICLVSRYNEKQDVFHVIMTSILSISVSRKLY